MVVGETVSEAWNTLYYFERAAETYILALQTGRPLRMIILDAEGSDYAN